ncbi:hypothetical protein [Terriglobus albidus]|uniref:hypothetical protein n=1 Tax=Terriglobus albidus TaxID=1592106 RepID=UPI0021DF7103|nr:hypothetical protein [Terriglobus albidus]
MWFRTVLVAGAVLSGGLLGIAQNAFPSSGNVGIGTLSPNSLLHLYTFTPSTMLTIQSGYTGPAEVGIKFQNSEASGSIVSNWWAGGMTFTTPRDLVQSGFHFFSQGGSEVAHIDTSSGGMAVGSTYASGTVQAPANGMIVRGNVGIGTTSPAAKLDVNGSVKISGSGASMTFPDSTVQSTAWNGTTCGGDYAESVDVTGDRKAYEPGDVLVIDRTASGKFAHSTTPYSRLVAGIYSTRPGLTGRRQGRTVTGEEAPMAMLGIVPTKVSAENGAIDVGDLLVSSGTEGYAMKGTDFSKLMGAVIGKAMAKLDTGKGLIEVLVSLQ